MKHERALGSASGLRPASAFVVIAAVVALVGFSVGRIAVASAMPRPPRAQIERDPEPEYTIVDRDARPMALFVQRLDLVMSPNAMWQAHTPDKIALALERAFDGRYPARMLLGQMLPDARDGAVRAGFELCEEQARRIDLWARHGSLDPEAESRPLRGVWVERAGRTGWRLCWQPALVLSQETRAEHAPEHADEPLRWSRTLADSLAVCVLGDGALRPGDDQELLEKQRSEIWSQLVPSSYALVVRDFDASFAPRLLAVLNEEHVAFHQMHIARERNRSYPAGHMQLLGAWGYLEEPQAEMLALEGLGFSAADLRTQAERERALGALSPEERERFPAQRFAHLARTYPLSGLERACDVLLSDADFGGILEQVPATYVFRRDRPVRQTARSYFLDSSPGVEPPRVRTTFDVLLQRQVGRELDRVMEKHKPAIAMAIALDLATGDVLALDSREGYEFSGFAPLYHQFTPGSTYKVVIMASALEAGVVTPNERIDVGNGEFHLPGRTIREAESTRTGVITAAECLAYSVNAGLAQIGMRVPAEELRGRLRALHYSERPNTGLGGERPGMLPKLPWRPNWEHASVSFGHETLVTLWQHAAALAAVVRGGEWRPLRLVDAVEQKGVEYELPRELPERVFSRATCDIVRSMMQLGAREGTGSPVASPDKLPGVVVGTKTGTAQKVPTEVCLHEELADQVRHRKEHTTCSTACRNRLRGRRVGHRECYTSSMCAWGHVEGSEREVLVLVVVDEPRGSEKFGSKVAGPTAIAILKEALGLTVFGEPAVKDLVAGFAPSSLPARDGVDQPWAEVQW